MASEAGVVMLILIGRDPTDTRKISPWPNQER